MTASTPAELVRVLSETRPVLLDFDGPVCPIFADGRNATIADAMRRVLRERDVNVPEKIATTYDPLHVLKFAHDLRQPALMSEVEETMRAGELQAAEKAIPTPGSADMVQACHDTGRPVVIVSNNSAPAIEAYLQLHELPHLVLAVVGRPPGRPDLMKPHPEPVRQALKILAAPSSECVLIGDSLTDIEVAHATGVPSIGYAKSPDRTDDLLAAQPDAVVDSIPALAAAIRTIHPLVRTQL